MKFVSSISVGKEAGGTRSTETTDNRFHLVYIRGYQGCKFVKEAATSVSILGVRGIQVRRGSSSLSVYLRGAGVQVCLEISGGLPV